MAFSSAILLSKFNLRKTRIKANPLNSFSKALTGYRLSLSFLQAAWSWILLVLDTTPRSTSRTANGLHHKFIVRHTAGVFSRYLQFSDLSSHAGCSHQNNMLPVGIFPISLNPFQDLTFRPGRRLLCHKHQAPAPLLVLLTHSK